MSYKDLQNEKRTYKCYPVSPLNWCGVYFQWVINNLQEFSFVGDTHSADCQQMTYRDNWLLEPMSLMIAMYEVIVSSKIPSLNCCNNNRLIISMCNIQKDYHSSKFILPHESIYLIVFFSNLPPVVENKHTHHTFRNIL